MRVRVTPFALAAWCALIVAAAVIWAPERILVAVVAAWAVAVITYLVARPR